MKWMIWIPGLLLLLLAVLLFLPLSVRLRYNSRLAVWAGVGRLRVKVYDSTAPKREKPQKPPKPAPQPEQEKKPAEKARPDPGQLWQMLQALPGPLRRLLRRVHIHQLALRILTTGEDAADAAIRAGHTAGAVYSIYGLLCGVFTVDPPQVLVLPDFFREEDNIYFEGCVTLRPIALAAFLAGFALNYAKMTAEKGPSAHNKDREQTSTQ